MVDNWSFAQFASGDRCGFASRTRRFLQALDTFRKGDIWDDAAFVAERVLTADELKAYLAGSPRLGAPEAGRQWPRTKRIDICQA